MKGKIKYMISASTFVMLFACGGGGGDKNTVIDSTGSLVVEGTAATGSAIANGIVNIKCLSGAALGTTRQDGGFSLTISNGAAPCFLRVESADQSITLHSLLEPGATKANITPLSELIVANIFNESPTAVYAGGAEFLRVTGTSLGSAISIVKATLLGLDSSLALGDIDPLKAQLIPAANGNTGNTFDQLLDIFGGKIISNGITLGGMVDIVKSRGLTTDGMAAKVMNLVQYGESTDVVKFSKVGSFKFLSQDTYRFGINEFYLGDFNGDGLQDALVAGRLTQPAAQSDWINSSVSMILQMAPGKFSIGTELLIQSGEEVIGGTEPAVVVHDFNRDGVDDFFIPGGTDSNYLVPSYFFLSQKGGKFIRKTVNTNRWFHGGVLADLDGDGYPEVVLSGYSNPQIYLKYENQNFTVKELAGTSTASGVTFGKFSDKGNELVFTDVGSKNESKQDGVIYSISSSNVNDISLVESGLLPISRFYLSKWKDLINSGASHEYRIHSLDINNDGYDDLIVLSSPPPGSSKNVRELQILMGRKDGVFVDETDARLIGFDAFAGPDYGLKIVDINLDGCPDIFVDGNSFDGIGSKYFLVNNCKGVLSVKGLQEIKAFLADMDGSVRSLTNPAMATPMTVVRGEGGKFYFLQLIYEQVNGARVASIYSGPVPKSFWK